MNIYFPQGGSNNNPLYKPFIKKWLFLFFTLILIVSAVALAPAADAGFFSGIWKFLAGERENKPALSTSASISMPLLGSASASGAGVGGPVSEDGSSLAVTQDSALVGTRNPAGVVPVSTFDQIFVYTVEQGDTPGSIADRFGISLNTLLWANNIRNPNLIKVGSELVILPVSGVQYEVRKGDTIAAIAKRFKGDADEILAFNGLASGDALEVGTNLIIPDGEIATVPSSGGINRYANLPDAGGYYIRPIQGGRKSRGIHGYNGVDLANSCGLPVFASAEGQVLISRSSGWNGGYGEYVAVSHSNRTQTLYAHLSQVFVVMGQRVSQGTVIGAIGSTGNSTGCHLHFEVRGARNPF